MHIPIKPVEALAEARPDYVFILPWNLKQEIIQQLNQSGLSRAKFIIPIPEVTIIDPKDRTRHLVVTLRDVTIEMQQQQKLAAIQDAGRELADLKPLVP